MPDFTDLFTWMSNTFFCLKDYLQSQTVWVIILLSYIWPHFSRSRCQGWRWYSPVLHWFWMNPGHGTPCRFSGASKMLRVATGVNSAPEKKLGYTVPVSEGIVLHQLPAPVANVWTHAVELDSSVLPGPVNSEYPQYYLIRKEKYTAELDTFLGIQRSHHVVLWHLGDARSSDLCGVGPCCSLQHLWAFCSGL